MHAATTGLNTSILEGCNAKFKTIKRVAYSFRDIGYYILKMH
ncbi:transposase [Anaerobiospirillum thomasii]